MTFSTKLPYYWLALGLLLVTLAVNFWIERSWLGYYFRAIKDEPDAARSIGVNIARYKQIALSVSAFFTALGGSLYAQKELYIDPNSVLSTALSIKMALVSILGGVGTLFGPVIGSVVLTSDRGVHSHPVRWHRPWHRHHHLRQPDHRRRGVLSERHRRLVAWSAAALGLA